MKRLSILAAAAIAGCTTVPPPVSGPRAAIGQTAFAGGARITPLQVIEDSRCPVNVQCVWTGRFVLLAKVEYRGGSELFQGNLTLGEPLRLGAEAVTLIAAEPGAVAGMKIDPRAYRFTFALTTTN